MTRCSLCNMPATRPGTIFEGGICQACLNYASRKTVNWQNRMSMLADLCNAVKRHRAYSKYDCIIPVSGGKDSYTLCKIMVEDMGMNPLLVTVTDSFTHTKAGQHNLRNLITHYKLNHWQYTINHDLFKRATRAAFEELGEPLKFVEYAIYTIPVMMARQFTIPLVVFGENSTYEYGGSKVDSPDAMPTIDTMVRKMEGEKPFWASHGVTKEEVDSIIPGKGREPRVVFMSYYHPWSSVTNREIAKSRGFKDLDDTKEWKRQGTCEQFEQIDSYGYLVHLYMKYPKFGFQRAADIASRRVREGYMSLEQAKKIMEEVDPVLDQAALADFCEAMGYTEEEFWQIAKKFDKMGVLDV